MPCWGSSSGSKHLSPSPWSFPARVSLLRGLHEDILRWHAGTSEADPIDGIELLDHTDIEALDINPTFSVDIAEEHFKLMDNWDNPRWTTHDIRLYGSGTHPSSTSGPMITDILKQISSWDKLSDLSPTGWQALYKKLRRYSIKWKLALIPFEAINVKYEYHGHGLCTCGMGLLWWKKMGDALFLVLEYLSPR